MMSKAIKRICMGLLCALLIVGTVLTCFAATDGKITVVLEDGEKNPINGMAVQICQIATMDSTGYYPAAGFTDSGISVAGIINNPSQAAAADVAKYVRENHIPIASKTTANGKAVFDKLGLGIWLVMCGDDSEYVFNPFFVFLPYESGGQLVYEVTSAPKTQDRDPNLCSVYVMKRWEDNNNAAGKRPQSVTVELLDGETVVAAVELCEQNGWAHTFVNVAKDGSYTVREQVVESYQAQYDGDAKNGFVITNIYAGEKLPQTGQLWWPIGIAAVAGVGFVLLGIIELGARKHGKKEN